MVQFEHLLAVTQYQSAEAGAVARQASHQRLEVESKIFHGDKINMRTYIQWKN
ncbi:hypothetical protein [Janthinobacterium sp. RB2R34]|uniref:hypothetical protein n=1 Tax=Janthinobacterium sp. RB2R34 TaxID=3424193 RepID=UPI003F25F235